MLLDWIETLKKNRAMGATMMKAAPKMMQAYQAFNASQNGNGALDAKTKELISLAVAVTTRCEGCIAAHSNGAVKAGATEAEIADALGTAMAVNTGAAYVYSLKVMDAYRQFSDAEAK
ncbi:MAG: carboxymuconolactone decarboxylase family protein [Proteobacteria bacterium]|nr:carboxymuconolactone decarboxylase family protein [Pseudomonadota bacterium]MBS0493838.1 carboxymuconolactone decarboxylase family protein [Pseudomonadota bacterium]